MLGYFRHGATWRLLAMGMRNGGYKTIKIPDVEPFGEGELDVPGRPRVIHTPGHSPGHVVFHFAEQGALIAGDALCTWNPLTGRPGPQIMPGRSRSRTIRRWPRWSGSRGSRRVRCWWATAIRGPPGWARRWRGRAKPGLARARTSGIEGAGSAARAESSGHFVGLRSTNRPIGRASGRNPSLPTQPQFLRPADPLEPRAAQPESGPHRRSRDRPVAPAPAHQHRRRPPRRRPRGAPPDPRSRPVTSEPSLRWASRRVKRAVHVWTGDRSSCGSSTDRRYEIGEPPKPSSLAAVRPPEVEKKNVCATWPPTVTTSPRVARTAAVEAGDLGQHAAVDLRAHVGEHVPRQPGGAAGERVGAGDDGLRVERLGRPARRHLGGHDAVQVVLERDVVDREHAAALAREHHAAAVEAVAQPVLGGAVQPRARAAGDRHRHPQPSAGAARRRRRSRPRDRRRAPGSGSRGRRAA